MKNKIKIPQRLDKYCTTLCPRCGNLSGEYLQLVLNRHHAPKKGYCVVARCDACLLNEIIDVKSSDVNAIDDILIHLKDTISHAIIGKVYKKIRI